MVSRYVLVLGALVQYGTAQFDCDPINLATYTDLKTSSGSYMTFVGRPTNIHSNFTCDICIKQYLNWRKDGQIVYSLNWSGGNSGPEPGYEDRVRIVLNDEGNGIYVMEWKDTDWTDLLPGQTYTTWDCYISTDACVAKYHEINVEYYRFPELCMNADGDRVDDYEALKAKGKGTANCSVISHPDSRIIMLQGDVVLSDASSCSPYSQHEFICSLSVPDVDFAKGFECKVTYNSPETGAYEEVIPDGCCAGGLYPQPTPLRKSAL